MFRFSLVALTLALALTACAPREQTAMEPEPMATQPAGAAGGVTAQATLDAAQNAGGLTSLAPTAAVSNIDSWISRLDGVPAAAPVVANLRTLKSQLQASTLDGMAIGMTLSELGEQTTAAAGGDASLRQLGQALSQAGQALSGM